MKHPPVTDLLHAGEPGTEDVLIHLGACRPCRQIASLGGARLTLEDALLVDRRVYLDRGELPAGGMGRTWRALDLRLGRMVALKEARSAPLRRRFEREARLAARLQHPSIVAVYEAGYWKQDGDTVPFYAMRLVEGRTLEEEIASRSSLEARLALLPSLIAVANAVAYAHEQRILHRDITPRNIILGSHGETVLIDWGLAKDLEAGAEPEDPEQPASTETLLTQVGAGTAHYMSPQQASGAPPGEAFDVYALGACLYHLLAGAPPYGAEPSGTVRSRLIAGPPSPLRTLAPRVPLPLEAITARSMERDASRRLPSARELAAELQRFQTGQLVNAHRYSPFELFRHWFARPAVRIAAASLLLVLVVGAVLGSRVIVERDRARTMAARLALERALDELAAGRPAAAAEVLSATDRREAAHRWVESRARAQIDTRVSELRGFPGGVVSVEFTPDGRTLLAQASDGPARLLRVPDLEPLPNVVANGAPVTARLAPDGEALTAVKRDGSIVLHELETGREHPLSPPSAWAEAVLMPDGRVVVFSSEQRSAPRLEFLDRTGVIGSCPVDHGPQTFVRITQTGTVAVSAGYGEVGVAFRALPSCRVLRRASIGGNVTSVAQSRDGSVIAASLDQDVALLEGGTLRRINGAHSGFILDLDVAGRGERFATASADHSAKLWSRSGALVATLIGHRAQVRSVAFSDDGAWVVTGSADGDARVWSAETGALIATLETGAALADAKPSPDGRWIAVASTDGRVVMWDLARATGGSAHRIGASWFAAAGGRAFFLDGRRWLAVGSDGREESGSLETEVVRAAANLAVTRIAVATTAGEILVLSTDDGREVDRLEADTTTLAFSEDGGLLIGTGTGEVLRRDPASRSSEMVAKHADAIGALAVSPDGRWIIAGSDDGAVTLVAPSRRTRTLPPHADAVSTVRIAGDSLLTTSYDGIAVVREIESGDERLRFRRHGSAAILASAVDTTHGLVATGDATGLTLVWAMRDGRLVRELPGVGSVRALAFSRHGERLVVQEDASFRTWDLASGAVLREVRAGPIVADARGALAEVVATRARSATVLWNAALPRPVPPRARSLPVSAPVRAKRHPSERCAEGARGFIDAVDPSYLLDAAVRGSETFVLWVERSGDGAGTSAPSGGQPRTAHAWLARIDGQACEAVRLNDLPLTIMEGGNGALEVSPDGSLRAFVIVKRRNDTWEVDGLEYQATFEPAPRVLGRDVVFRDWNAGWHPFYEGGDLRHFAYAGRWRCIGLQRLPKAPGESSDDTVLRARTEQAISRQRRLAGLRRIEDPAEIGRALADWLRERVSHDDSGLGAAPRKR